jgi:hypothetical protein
MNNKIIRELEDIKKDRIKEFEMQKDKVIALEEKLTEERKKLNELSNDQYVVERAQKMLQSKK